MSEKFDLNNPAFKDETKAREWLEASRWPDGPARPFCKSGEHDPLGGKSMGPGWYHCSECREKFTVRVGTLYERSHIPAAQVAARHSPAHVIQKRNVHASTAPHVGHYLQIRMVHDASHSRGSYRDKPHPYGR